MVHWTCCAGSTLLIPSGPNNLKHLHVILNNPIDLRHLGYAENSCLLVGISTVPVSAPFDNSCVLHPIDHPFIIHERFVYYRHIRLERASDLVTKAGSGFFVPKETINAISLQRIIDGLHSSMQTPIWALDVPLD
ncbi:MAG: hypothetical protein Q7L07_04780 [Pseudohongiella sp.]|nr:hypothetical protein [Pseudohongiella sp.]MDP2286625.1 hypothetical protein [Pseudohongiella sp.]